MGEASTRVSFEGSAGVIVGDLHRPPRASRGLVVLLHGGGQTRHSWARAATALAAAGWTALTYDARGHGDSAWDADGAYTIDRYVADLDAVLTQVDEGTPAALVGASLGGMTALMALARHPRLSAGLVLVDITPRPRATGIDRVKKFMTSHPDGFANLDEVADAVASYNPGRRRADPSGLARNVRRGDDGRWRWHWDPAILPEGDEQAAPLVRPEEAVAAAGRLTVPTLLIAGGSSDVVSEEEVAEFLDVMPIARAVTLTGASHMVVGDRNDACVAAVLDFLKG